MLKKILIGLTLLAAIAGPAATAAEPAGPCNTETRPYSQHEVVQIITCAAERWGMNPDTYVCMGSHESGLDPKNKSNPSYHGLFQYSSSLWNSEAAQYWHPDCGRRHINVPSIYNGRAQIMVTVKFTRAEGFGSWSRFVNYTCPGW